MQIKSLTDSPVFGQSQFRATGGGGTVTGPVILSGDPTGLLQATTKQYIDNLVNLIPASKLVSGTLAASTFPAFTGDVTKALGVNTITLNNNGVAAGTFSKYTVDTKGRVSLGDVITASDVPNLSWGKFTSNVPTTLGGYGITDAVSKAGDTLTNFLSLTGTPSNALHAVSKSYADSGTASIQKYTTGDLAVRGSTTTPSGFLRANGGEVSTITYSALYAVIGDTYSTRTQSGGGQPWMRQYQFNNAGKGDVTGWAAATGLPAAVYGAQVIVTKTRVYLLGGVGSAAVYTAPLNSDGSLGTWVSATSLPAALGGSQAIVTTNRVYLLGGSNAVGTIVATVYTAPINADGTLGTWTTDVALPVAVSYSRCVMTTNRVYLIGGNQSGTASAAVYTAVVNADGTLGTWTASASLPSAMYAGAAFVTRNRVYVFGLSTTVYTAPINADGTIGTWTTGTPLPANVGYTSVVVTGTRVYSFGSNGTGPNAVVYMAPINADGTLGTWTTGTSIYAGMRDASVIVTVYKVHLLGGVDTTSTVSSVVQMASFSGGSNDYSAYYSGTVTYTTNNTFRLPDYTSKESSGLCFFIKQ